MSANNIDTAAVIEKLNKVLELELAGVVRYTHYSFMVYGFGRIPIVSWLRSQASESIMHAHEAGELITQLGGEPSLGIGPLLDNVTDNIAEILEESIEHEKAACAAYHDLLDLVAGKDVMLEEYATRLIADETKHEGEVRKMLRRPGG